MGVMRKMLSCHPYPCRHWRMESTIYRASRTRGDRAFQTHLRHRGQRSGELSDMRVLNRVCIWVVNLLSLSLASQVTAGDASPGKRWEDLPLEKDLRH